MALNRQLAGDKRRWERQPVDVPIRTEGTGVSLATVLRVSSRSFRVPGTEFCVRLDTTKLADKTCPDALSSLLGQNQQYSATA
jgi:hypothetical protein